MAAWNDLNGIDIYLIDQLMKGRIGKEQRILDAGCGSGRNIKYLVNAGYSISAFDPNVRAIESLKNEFPNIPERFTQSTIEGCADTAGFDVVICNAVLHFAESHIHFDEMFNKLIELLVPGGMLFIRMTSDIGIEDKLDQGVAGVYQLPDTSTRYLVTRSKVDMLLKKHNLELLDPVKTVNVDGLRCMTTLVFKKN